MLRVARQARVVDPLDRRVALRATAAIFSAFSQCRSMRSARVLRPRSARKLVERARRCAPTAFCRKPSCSASSAFVADHRDAADHVGMAVEVLGGRVHHRCRSRARAAAAGRGWRRCCRRRRAMPRFLRERGDRREVGELEQRVGRRLDPDHPRVGPDRRLDSVEVAPGRRR